MFLHIHPYKPFIPKNATKLIVGTIPPPRFSSNKLYKEDVDFCYGSKFGLLWPILDKIFNLHLAYQNTPFAIQQRKQFLIDQQIGICDMVASCEREKSDASDMGMKNIQLRNLIDYLEQHPSIDTILFMGGNSKNGPEYFFRKNLNTHDFKLQLVAKESPKIHHLQLNDRTLKTISLISPSNAANRSIGANSLFKKLKEQNKSYTTFDFRVEQYQRYFL